MATKMDPALRRQLEFDIAAIGRDCPVPPARVAAAAPPELSPVYVDNEPVAVDEPFGRWLLAQQDRGDWIDDLASAARGDRSFPKNGSPNTVRSYLGRRGVGDADVFEQIDDAERCWRSLGISR